MNAPKDGSAATVRGLLSEIASLLPRDGTIPHDLRRRIAAALAAPPPQPKEQQQ